MEDRVTPAAASYVAPKTFTYVPPAASDMGARRPNAWRGTDGTEKDSEKYTALMEEKERTRDKGLVTVFSAPVKDPPKRKEHWSSKNDDTQQVKKAVVDPNVYEVTKVGATELAEKAAWEAERAARAAAVDAQAAKRKAKRDKQKAKKKAKGGASAASTDANNDNGEEDEGEQEADA